MCFRERRMEKEDRSSVLVVGHVAHVHLASICYYIKTTVCQNLSFHMT
jgi:hypothetical protein